jgi:hypothetical protein
MDDLAMPETMIKKRGPSSSHGREVVTVVWPLGQGASSLITEAAHQLDRIGDRDSVLAAVLNSGLYEVEPERFPLLQRGRREVARCGYLKQ